MKSGSRAGVEVELKIDLIVLARHCSQSPPHLSSTRPRGPKAGAAVQAEGGAYSAGRGRLRSRRANGHTERGSEIAIRPSRAPDTPDYYVLQWRLTSRIPTSFLSEKSPLRTILRTWYEMYAFFPVLIMYVHVVIKSVM